MKKLLIIILIITIFPNVLKSQVSASDLCDREHLLMDFNWRFAFGHPYDVKEDYGHATGYFSYITKAGYGDGPAAVNFDDRPWRVLNLPHDWAVELPFDALASHSHGYKTLGHDFPETSVGWYRKSFQIPVNDSDKRISIQFDGVHRNAKFWINGFFLGTEPSGYSDIEFDISPYLNYGGKNIISVRVDATMEEGWFYEGAGIYRHVWLNKTNPLHIKNNQIVTATIENNYAEILVHTSVENETDTLQSFRLLHRLLNHKGDVVSAYQLGSLELKAHEKQKFTQRVEVESPLLWSIENPYLYQLKTSIVSEKSNQTIDETFNKLGIRSIRFDADSGFFLNGEPVKIKGTCNHQDHAGVGTAMPDALQDFRIKQLKSMGSNAYRCSHNPPTPELLDACDRLGMLVLCENRLMGTSPEILDHLRRMLVRDRNHPSVILWSIGNEEWAIEVNEKGTRIGHEMQNFARQFDASRPYTVAASGGWGHGVDIGMDIMGFNYLGHGNIDEHHQNFPQQPCIGTEESTSSSTRGIYEDDLNNGHMAPTDRSISGSSIEKGWQFYGSRDFLSGLFFWTGFDYRGESNPLSFPAISSQFGILDVCGFPKDPFHYLKAKWCNEPYLHIAPHWNWAGKEDEAIQVWVQSNCDEVELFLNGKSLGKKVMPEYSHLEWTVDYQPGKLFAKGYINGEKQITYKTATAEEAYSIDLLPDKSTIAANKEDIAVITVQLNDAQGRFMPIANREITFHIEGPGKIIGVGNGDPSCHEPDKVFQDVQQILLAKAKIAALAENQQFAALSVNFDDSSWPYYIYKREQMIFPSEKTVVIRGEFELPEFSDETQFILFGQSLANNQSVYINGDLIASNIEREAPMQIYKLKNNMLKPGINNFAIVGSPLQKRSQWEELNTNAGLIQMLIPQPAWKRSTFNGLAQVIVQADSKQGKIVLTASAEGLKSQSIIIQTTASVLRPAIP